MGRNHAFFPAKALEIVAVIYKHCFGEITLSLTGFWGYVVVHVCGGGWLSFSLVFFSKEIHVEDKATNVHPPTQ